jgi:hypothetical protein
VNIAWAPGQAGGASLGGVVASATTDAVPYLCLTVLCLLTFRFLLRSYGFSVRPELAER